MYKMINDNMLMINDNMLMMLTLGYGIRNTIYLYLSTSSFLPSGSKLFLIPSNVLLTASDAPIMGFSTAIGTARTTALRGP